MALGPRTSATTTALPSSQSQVRVKKHGPDRYEIQRPGQMHESMFFNEVEIQDIFLQLDEFIIPLKGEGE